MGNQSSVPGDGNRADQARLDALHVASAVVAGVKYLLTQNCRHIANATVLPDIYGVLEDLGFGFELTVVNASDWCAVEVAR